jgi:multiple sugar transport system substrate-binding protein
MIRLSIRGSLCALGALLLLGAGCGRAPDRRVVLRYSYYGAKDDVVIWKAIVAEFERRNPDLRIQAELIVGMGPYEQKLMAMMVGRSAPDVIMFDDEPFPQFAQYDVFVDLGPYLDRDPTLRRSDFFPIFMEAFRYRGHQYCLPWDGTTHLVYYNKDALAAAGLSEPKPGWTWDDFIATAKALTKDRDGDGRTDQFGCLVQSWMNAIMFMWQAGGSPYNEDLTRCTADSPGCVEGMRFNQDLRFKYHVAPLVTDMPGMSTEQQFASGAVVMSVGPSYSKPWMRPLKINWDVAHMPAGPAGRATRMTIDGIGIWKRSPRKQEAWRFIRFVLGDWAQRQIARSDLGIPAIKRLAWDPAFVRPDTPQHEERFLEAMAYGRLQPINEKWTESRVVWDREWDLLMLSRKPPEAVARDVARGINAILAEP